MPLDALQIALEHHRAGRLRQAEAGYRVLLERDPRDPDASHWLGVLLYQAGRADQALPLLERAATDRSADAAYQHNLGQAYHTLGRDGEAIAALSRAAVLEPSRAETASALAIARLARRAPGDADAAVVALRAAVGAGADAGELSHDLGVALLASGHASDAIVALRAALERRPEDVSSFYHLALAHRAKSEWKEVRKALIKALEIDPSFARAWHALGVLDAEAGNLTQAASSLRKAIRAKSDYAAAYQALGQVLERQGSPLEARQAFELGDRAGQHGAGGSKSAASDMAGVENPDPAIREAIPQGSVEELERRLTPDAYGERLYHALAAVTNLPAPPTLPAQTVTKLFDEYADRFDDHLVDKLQYRAPEMLAEAIRQVKPDKLLDVFDLGCGTGLCGPLLRPMAASLRGVDLSPAMIEKSRDRGVYDRLEIGDLIQTLASTPPGSLDLLVAADVLIYVGDLAPVFEAAVPTLRPGGMLAFSVETTAGDRFHLQKRVRRFAHSKPYVQRVAAMFGLRERFFEPVTIRFNAGQPVPGFIIVLMQPS